MSQSKSRPKYSQTLFVEINICTACTMEKSSPKMFASSVIFKNLLCVNNSLIGENSPHQVTLHSSM
jgi:hypothetical protein